VPAIEIVPSGVWSLADDVALKATLARMEGLPDIRPVDKDGIGDRGDSCGSRWIPRR